MKKLIPLYIVILALASCSHATKLQQQFYDAEKLRIYVDGNGPLPFIHYETNDVDHMKDWMDYLDEKGTKGCGEENYKGTLTLFFTDSDSLLTHISFGDHCGTLSYSIKGDKNSHMALINEAGIGFLHKLMTAQ